MPKQVILYLPVIHAGYLALLRDLADVDEVLVLGASFQEQFPWMKKEIRALGPREAVKSLQPHYPAVRIRVIETLQLRQAIWAQHLVLADEEVSHQLVEFYELGDHEVSYVPTFLRWDRSWSLAQRPTTPDLVVSVSERDKHFLQLAQAQAQLSSDWWRQVGVVVVRNGELLLATYNQHGPTAYAPYINGDPRNSFKRGRHIDLSTAIHGEAAAIGRAAREGMALAGADIYVTTFPCPPCARLIAEAGVAACYFAGPYAILDGEDILRQAGVRLIWVDTSAATA